MSDQSAIVVDAKGLSCPMPVVKAKLAIEKVGAGEVIRVLATDPGSMADFDNWAKMSGHDLLEAGESDGVYSYVIRKGA